MSRIPFSTRTPRYGFPLSCLLLAFLAAGNASAIPEAGSLANTKHMLLNQKKLNVGYFGGSITDGSGASDQEKTSWRALSTAWLKKTYPDAVITAKNAAIGGTGSDLGAFRCSNDLLPSKPDLVFLEYSVNDFGKTSDKVLASVEGIVRQILAKNPYTDIVFVYTLTKSMAGAYETGNLPNTTLWDQEVADHYNLPSVNVGKKLWEAVKAGQGTWATFTGDEVHPTDKGYRIYEAEVERFLGAALVLATPAHTPKAMPTALTPKPLDRGRLVDAWSLNAAGWAKETESLAGKYPHRIAARTAGTELNYAFSGSAIGIYWLVAPTSGDIEWSIDGGTSKRETSWDVYAKSFTRANYIVLSQDLTAGPHTLKIKVLGEKNAESTDTWIRIGALMTNDSPGVGLADSPPDPANPYMGLRAGPTSGGYMPITLSLEDQP